MIPRTVSQYGIRLLALIAVACSTYNLLLLGYQFPSIFPPIANLSNLFMPGVFFIMCIPVYLGFYYGLRTFFKQDASRIKGLLAIYALVGLLYFEELNIDNRIFPNWLDKYLEQSLVSLLILITAVAVYLFFSRLFLRSLNQPCPPLRQSLPSWIIFLIALQCMSIGLHFIIWKYPPSSSDNLFIANFLFALSILLPIEIYKLGIWLFVRQEKLPLKIKIPVDPKSKNHSSIDTVSGTGSVR